MELLRLKDLREDREIKQEEMAKYLGISQTNYSKYELGKVNIPIDALKKLADFYRTSVDYILGMTDEMKPYPKSKKFKR
ncbi:MAG: helix-turn-helix transcriptional regulator [Clostridia bacterium]|nr:helix-turn-helix transcriptional regulator [Clostridia bacterium]